MVVIVYLCSDCSDLLQKAYYQSASFWHDITANKGLQFVEGALHDCGKCG